MPTLDYQINFQPPVTPIAEGIRVFHDDLIVLLVGVLIFVLYIILVCLIRADNAYLNKGTTPRLVHATILEIIWTIVPALILVLIAIPSFSLLYSIDEIVEPMFTVKVVGHQWYWSYEFLDPEVITHLYNNKRGSNTFVIESGNEFDSYLLSNDELVAGQGLTQNYLLTVDNHLFLPAETHIRAIVTSADVLHSWAIPSLGVKLDACPGRLNQTSIFIKRNGIYYGQCSEICGVNHGFRPIGIVSQIYYASASGVISSTIHDFESIFGGIFFQNNN